MLFQSLWLNLAPFGARKTGRPESKRTLGHALGKSLGHLMRLGNGVRPQNWPVLISVVLIVLLKLIHVHSHALPASCYPRELTGLAKAKLHGSYEKIEGGQPYLDSVGPGECLGHHDTSGHVHGVRFVLYCSAELHAPHRQWLHRGGCHQT